MKETIEQAKEELKRVDHLYYVSLKYTKTVDVIKNIIQRLINAYSFTIDALAIYLKNKKKLKTIPNNPIEKAEEIRNIFKDDKDFSDNIDFYFFLRKLNRAEFTRAREFRRHVTMGAKVDGKSYDITIDVIEVYYERAKIFVEKAYKLIHGIKDE